MPFVKDDLPKIETSPSGGRLDISIDSDTGDELVNFMSLFLKKKRITRVLIELKHRY